MLRCNCTVSVSFVVCAVWSVLVGVVPGQRGGRRGSPVVLCVGRGGKGEATAKASIGVYEVRGVLIALEGATPSLVSLCNCSLSFVMLIIAAAASARIDTTHTSHIRSALVNCRTVIIVFLIG